MTELQLTDRMIDEQSAVFAEDLPNHSAQIDRYEQAGLTRAEGWSLEARAAKIIGAGRRTVLELGRELLAAREEAKYGTWSIFLARCGLEERTAQRYMSVVERFGSEPDIMTALPSTALYALAAPSADPVVVGEIVAEVEAGARPTVAEVKQRLTPTPAPAPPARPAPTPTPPPARPAAAEIATAPAPTPRAPVALTPLTPAAPPPLLQSVAAGVDLQMRKLLAAKRALLAAALELVDAQLYGNDGPAIVVRQADAIAAARIFVNSQALGGAAAMLAFAAVVEEGVFVPTLESEGIDV